MSDIEIDGLIERTNEEITNLEVLIERTFKPCIESFGANFDEKPFHDCIDERFRDGCIGLVAQTDKVLAHFFALITLLKLPIDRWMSGTPANRFTDMPEVAVPRRVPPTTRGIGRTHPFADAGKYYQSWDNDLFRIYFILSAIADDRNRLLMADSGDFVRNYMANENSVAPTLIFDLDSYVHNPIHKARSIILPSPEGNEVCIRFFRQALEVISDAVG